MEAKRCDDCGAYFTKSYRGTYYLVREGIGGFYEVEGKLDLCDKCWNKMLKIVFADLEAKE